MKIQVKVQNELRRIEANLQRALDYLQSDRVAGIAHTTNNPNGMSYTIRNRDCLKVATGLREHIDVMNKHYGSDITGLEEGLRLLKALLNTQH